MEPGHSPLAALPVRFDETVWAEEVDRLSPGSPARSQAGRARRQIELGRDALSWRACRAHGPDGTRLPSCAKLYVPLDAEGATVAPFAFVFRLTRGPGGLGWVLIAFGERHPSNPRTRTVYERAHRRLHGRYPRPAR